MKDQNSKPNSPLLGDGEHIGLRIALLILAALVAAGALTYFVYTLINPESEGWQEIETSGAETSATGALSLWYNVGSSSERKALTALYTQAADDAYKALSGEDFEGTQGLAYLNAHPGEEVTVDPILYAALEALEAAGSRYLYYAPLYERYRGLCSCDNDADTELFDPALSEEIAAYLAEANAYAADPEAITVELLGENRVRLEVSEAYRAFAQENEVEYLDLYWLCDAFVVDYVADTLAQSGYTDGSLSAFEGFSRLLGQESFRLSFYGLEDGAVYTAASADVPGPTAVVSLRSFPLSELDSLYYYVREDGKIRTPFVSTEDSLCHAAAESLTLLQQAGSCADLALLGLSLFTADAPDSAALQESVTAVWVEDGQITQSGPSLTLAE